MWALTCTHPGRRRDRTCSTSVISEYTWTPCNLNWSFRVDAVCARVQQCMYFLRRLRSFDANEAIICLYYRAVRHPIMFLWKRCVVWTPPCKPINRATKLLGNEALPTLQDVFHKSVQKLALKRSTDPTHVLHSQYELLPSGRRYRVHKCRTNRYKHSFVPNSVQFSNWTKTCTEMVRGSCESMKAREFCRNCVCVCFSVCTCALSWVSVSEKRKEGGEIEMVCVCV